MTISAADNAGIAARTAAAEGAGLQAGVAQEVRPNVIIWPCWMPKPQRGDYGYSPVDRRTKTEMEVGGIYRVEFDTDETQVTCSLILTTEQAAWFESFERDILRQGSRWFEFPLWVGGRLQDHLVRFRERPALAATWGCHVKYSLVLEVSKRELICPQYAEALLHYSPEELRYYDRYFDNLVNSALPGLTNIPGEVWP